MDQIRLKGSKCVRSIVIETAISRLVGAASESQRQAYKEREQESKHTVDQMRDEDRRAREDRERIEVF